MKRLLALLLALTSLNALADFDCFGETYNGTVANVQGITQGAYAYPSALIVKIMKKQKVVLEREIGITQFYDAVRKIDGKELSMIGANGMNFESNDMVFVQYLGKNYETPWNALNSLQNQTRDSRENSMNIFLEDVNGKSLDLKFKDIVCSQYFDA